MTLEAELVENEHKERSARGNQRVRSQHALSEGLGYPDRELIDAARAGDKNAQARCQELYENWL